MKKLSQSEQPLCQKCIKECDYIDYKKVLLKKEPSNVPKNVGGTSHYNKYTEFTGKTLHWRLNGQGVVGGSKAFVELFEDVNGTITDKNIKTTFDAFYATDLKYKYETLNLEKFKDYIIVHLRFMKPDIDWIDTKYNDFDKFANFGGNFGIFAEITGSSFLGIVNLCILLFKILFSCNTRERKMHENE